jgi:hypothetical protein
MNIHFFMHVLEIFKTEFHKCVTLFDATGCNIISEITCRNNFEFFENFPFDMKLIFPH